MRKLLKLFVGFLIQAIESIEYRHLDLDENDPSKKILDEVPVDFCIDTPEGPSHVSKIYKTQPYHIYEITLENGNVIQCADNHILYIGTENYIFETYAKKIRVGDHIVTKEGDVLVTKINVTPYKMCMYDISVENDTHTYYTADGVMNHNTTTIAAFLSWMIVFHPDRNILVVANKEKTAIEIVDKITNIFRGLPYFMKPGCINFGKMSVKLENGSQIICSATTNTASIGFTIHCVLLDEFAHIPDNIVGNFWRSVYPTLSSSEISQCIITSTPNGTTNKFFEIWDKSINGKNSFVNMRTDYWEVPGHDQEWAEQMRADFGEEEFAQEFELQFNINSKMIAKTDDLQFMGRIAKDYVHKEIYIDNKYLKDEHIYWHPDFDPNDIQEDDNFLFLVDLAEGLNDDKGFKSKKREPDFNTINILKVVPNSIANLRRYRNYSCKVEDAFRFVQVGKYTSNEDDEVQCANVAAALAYDLMHDDDRESVRIALEMNFNGKSFTQTFQNHPKYYDGTIQRTYHTKPVPGEVQRRRLGFKTTGNKEHFCLKGNKLLNMKRIIVTDRETMFQVQSFGYVKGKLMGIACHDDLSMPIFNHVSRMLDEETFKGWLEEILTDLKDEVRKYQINNMLEMWDMENPEVSDEEFNSTYLDGPSYPSYPNMTTQSMNPYSSNNYGGTMGMSSGYPTMNPYSSGGMTLPHNIR